MYLIEYQPPTALNRWRHKRRLRKMAEEVLPRSRDWVLVLAGIAGWTGFLALGVGWGPLPARREWHSSRNMPPGKSALGG